VLRGLERDPQTVQRLQHLHPEWSDARVAAIAELARRAHHHVAYAAADDGERILRPEIGVLPEPDHEKELVARAMQVEVVAVVEVPVAGGDVPDRFGDLMDGIVVPRRERHGRRS